MCVCVCVCVCVHVRPSISCFKAVYECLWGNGLVVLAMREAVDVI